VERSADLLSERVANYFLRALTGTRRRSLRAENQMNIALAKANRPINSVPKIQGVPVGWATCATIGSLNRLLAMCIAPLLSWVPLDTSDRALSIMEVIVACKHFQN
jgi:hypothetical protein